MPKKVFLEVTNKCSPVRQAGEHDMNRGDIFALFSREILADIEHVVILGRHDVELCAALNRIKTTIANLVPHAEISIVKDASNIDINGDSIFISAEGNVFPFLWTGELADKLQRLNGLIQTNPLWKILECELFKRLKTKSLANVWKTEPELFDFHVEKLPFSFANTKTAFSNTAQLVSFAQSLAHKIFFEDLFKDKQSGIKFYTDEQFNVIDSTDKLMIVPWKSPSENHNETFFVISGDYLTSITPGAAEVFKTFNDAGINFEYYGNQGVCVLIGMETVFRHTDIGGRCVFNQTLWGADNFSVHIWDYGAAERWMFTDADFNSLKPSAIVHSSLDKIWTMDTTKDHSSVTNKDAMGTLGIINLQCTDPFAEAVRKLKAANLYEPN